MRKLGVYYVVITVPFLIVIWAWVVKSELFIFLLVFYSSFRLWYDRRKLIGKGVIGPDYGYFRFLIHGNIDYFRQLYLEP